MLPAFHPFRTPAPQLSDRVGRRNAGLHSELLLQPGQHSVILIVIANPEPFDVILLSDPESAVRAIDPY